MFNNLKGKKILVAGGAGFVGCNLIKGLREAGVSFIRATLHRKDPLYKDSGAEYVKCDLLNQGDCRKVTEGIDYVFMCAANTSGAAVIERTPLAHVTPNVIMNTLMLEEAYRAGVEKFLFISSNTVYPPVDYPVKEEEMMSGDLYEKYFCVGWMKRFGEILCEMYATRIKRPMKTVVVRPANIYGPYDDFEWESSHVIPALIRKAVERHDPLEVWGDGSDIKDLIYVDDFIEGMMLAMDKIDGFAAVNIGTGIPISIKESLGHILEADGYKEAKIAFNSSKPTMIPKRLIDVSRARDSLGFEAKTSFARGVKKTIEWYRRSLSPAV